VIYKIPPDLATLPEGVDKAARLRTPPGALQGKNSWMSGQTVGYRGPFPPSGHGVHHYHFRLYALEARLAVEPGLSKKTLLGEMAGHVLAEGDLVGTYAR
jgi:Raf kinase inhibitor-like YbhB/YbcL family protein